jgi:hypothetical protein
MMKKAGVEVKQMDSFNRCAQPAIIWEPQTLVGGIGGS